ncbi:unnamed protein product [Paramecium octaurelia]|uniref:Uncharacterized protein n=1 Tax=Paramecium octaurelia TaxID=43137 RepID=A0A8S1WY56_PAROT|nr:unnamed protein product [Paramecium octaurelia]
MMSNQNKIQENKSIYIYLYTHIYFLKHRLNISYSKDQKVNNMFHHSHKYMNGFLIIVLRQRKADIQKFQLFHLMLCQYCKILQDLPKYRPPKLEQLVGPQVQKESRFILLFKLGSSTCSAFIQSVITKYVYITSWLKRINIKRIQTK